VTRTPLITITDDATEQASTAVTSAVDVLVPAATEVTEDPDAIDELLTGTPHGVTDRDREDFRRLHRWQRDRAAAKAAYEALGGSITALAKDLIDRRNERGWRPLPTTVTDQGEPVRPYVRGTLYPKFRTDPETGESYTRADVVDVLDAAGLGYLVETGYSSTAFAAVIRDQVKQWREQVSETPLTDEDGEPVDAWGTVLTAEERDDPTADELGIHPALRPYVTAVLLEEIRFTKG